MTFFEPLPWSIEYEGKIYELTASFDNVLKMYEQLDDLLDYEKVDMMLYWLVKGDYPVDTGLLQAICAVLFPPHEGNEQKSFDYIQDSDYIYAAFQQAYGIDLYEQQGKLHWLQFVALMSSLPSDTRFSEIVQIRLMPIPKDAERKADVIKLKQKYALTVSDEERRRNLQEGLQKMAKVLLSRVVKDG